jgi:DNA-binding CsgD family transcriptional regulator
MGVAVYDELKKIWGKITMDEDIKDAAFDIKAQKQLLDVFMIGEYFYMIVNVRRSRFELISPEFTTITGYDALTIDLPTFLSYIHPDDLPYFLNFESAIEEFFGKLSGEDIFKYKIQYDFRLRCANGHYKRLLHQFVVIQHDAFDVKTFTIDTDITHLKKEAVPYLSFIGIDGRPSYMNVDVRNIYKMIKPVLTNREKDVLRAIANGMNSIEISNFLKISKHTVDVHRKNILRKTDSKSTVETIRRAYDNGWI